MTIEGTTHRLARPFLVLATQNPIEYEGTYPLPGGAARPLPAARRLRLPDGRGRVGGARAPAGAPRGRGRARARGRRRRRCSRCRPPSRTCTSAPSVGRYIVDLVGGDADERRDRGRREPARQPGAAQALALPGRARGPRLRHARRREGGRGAGARAPADAASRSSGCSGSRPRTSCATCSSRCRRRRRRSRPAAASAE